MIGTLAHASEETAVFITTFNNSPCIGGLRCGEPVLILGVWINPMKTWNGSPYCDMFKVLTRHGLGFVNETEVSK